MDEKWAKVVGIQDNVWVIQPLEESPNLTRCVPGHYITRRVDQDWEGSTSIRVEKNQIPDYRIVRDT